MEESPRVFLCSTYSDLVDERKAVLDAIRLLKLQHGSMELFGARTGRPIETCLDEVRRSDIVIVIVGYRYGSKVPNLGISFSEAEYDEALRLGKRCLVYLRDEEMPILPKKMESDPEKLRLLKSFLDKLNAHHTVARFQDAQDLAKKVEADVQREIQPVGSQTSLYFLKDETKVEYDEHSRQYRIRYYFGSNQGQALKDVFIKLRFDHVVEAIDSGIVEHPANSGIMRRQIDPDEKGYSFHTNILHTLNYVRIEVISKTRINLMSVKLSSASFANGHLPFA